MVKFAVPAVTVVLDGVTGVAPTVTVVICVPATVGRFVTVTCTTRPEPPLVGLRVTTRLPVISDAWAAAIGRAIMATPAPAPTAPARARIWRRVSPLARSYSAVAAG